MVSLSSYFLSFLLCVTWGCSELGISSPEDSLAEALDHSQLLLADHQYGRNRG